MSDRELRKELDLCRRTLITMAYAAEQDCKNGRISVRAFRKRLELIEAALQGEVPGVVRP